MAQILVSPMFHVDDSTGAPLSGGKVYTYAAGTSTPKTTYNSSSGAPGTENANPVILNSRGEAKIYGDGSYKIVVKDSLDNTIWTVDNYKISGTVSTSDITDLAVTTAKLASNVLSADTTGRGKMQDGYVTSAKLDTAGVQLPNGSTATTQSDGDNSTKVATTAYVDTHTTNEKKLRKSYTTTNTTATQLTSPTYDMLKDGSVPQISEGLQVFSYSYTPVASDSVIEVEAVIMCSTDGTGGMTLAIFKDSTANAVAACGTAGTNVQGIAPFTIKYREVSGSTTARTYSVRAGVAVNGQTCGVNRSAIGGNLYGSGTVVSYFKINEYAP